MIYKIVSIPFDFLTVAILVRAFLSWMPAPRDQRIYKLINILHRITEPILAPIRSMIERSSFGRNIMFDVSPIIAILLIGFIRNVVIRLIFYFV